MSVTDGPKSAIKIDTKPNSFSPIDYLLEIYFRTANETKHKNILFPHFPKKKSPIRKSLDFHCALLLCNHCTLKTYVCRISTERKWL